MLVIYVHSAGPDWLVCQGEAVGARNCGELGSLGPRARGGAWCARCSGVCGKATEDEHEHDEVFCQLERDENLRRGMAVARDSRGRHDEVVMSRGSRCSSEMKARDDAESG